MNNDGFLSHPVMRWLGGALIALLIYIASIFCISNRDYRNLLVILAIGSALLVAYRYLIARATSEQSGSDADPPESPTWLKQMVRRCDAMIEHALNNGIAIDSCGIGAVDKARNWQANATDDKAKRYTLAALTATHDKLARQVSPARPETLALLYDDGSVEDEIAFPWLGRVRVIRMFINVVLIVLPIFIVLGITIGRQLDPADPLFSSNEIVESSDDASAGSDETGSGSDETDNDDVDSRVEEGTTNSGDEGGSTDVNFSYTSIATAVYILSAAAVGAIFSGLYRAAKYVRNRTYSQAYESSYWVTATLGMVAGAILAVVLSQVLPFVREGEGRYQLTVPLLAVLGGFSSELVYKLLEKVKNGIEATFSISPTEQQMAELREDVRRANLDGPGVATAPTMSSTTSPSCCEKESIASDCCESGNSRQHVRPGCEVDDANTIRALVKSIGGTLVDVDFIPIRNVTAIVLKGTVAEEQLREAIIAAVESMDLDVEVIDQITVTTNSNSTTT